MLYCKSYRCTEQYPMYLSRLIIIINPYGYKPCHCLVYVCLIVCLFVRLFVRSFVCSDKPLNGISFPVSFKRLLLITPRFHDICVLTTAHHYPLFKRVNFNRKKDHTKDLKYSLNGQILSLYLRVTNCLIFFKRSRQEDTSKSAHVRIAEHIMSI